MGRGSYTASDWASLRSSKGLVKTSSVNYVFSNTSALYEFDSKNVKLRESRDSEDSPKSTPIIIGFDVTASMGYLAKELATNTLNKVVTELNKNESVKNPHVLCSAIGDCKGDTYPLQVTHFEADIRIIQQLTQLFLEGGGGGNEGESYNLLWYFAAFHTQSDCVSKRGKKGYLFTIGDDMCHKDLSVNEIKNVFSDVVPYSVSNEELLFKLQQQYNVYHIHIDTGKTTHNKIMEDWKNLLPSHVTEIHINDIEYLSDLISAIVSLSCSASVNEVLSSMDQFASERIARSIAYLNFEEKPKNIISF